MSCYSYSAMKQTIRLHSFPRTQGTWACSVYLSTSKLSLTLYLSHVIATKVNTLTLTVRNEVKLLIRQYIAPKTHSLQENLSN